VRKPSSAPRCVLVFARAPLGEARAKSLPAARELFECTRARAMAAAAASGADVVVAAPDAPGPVPPGTRTLAQRGDSFAERLRSAFADARRLGYREIVVVPADVPALRAHHLREAFRRLRDHATVLGPSPDGGVYLLGIRGDFEAVLAGVPWCTPRVFARLLANARGAAVLAPLADVDGHPHLRALRADAGLDAEVAFIVAALLTRVTLVRPRPASVAPAGPHRAPFAPRPPPPTAA
jgi:glycosyltransferase A (GT-A) superfamily protein (DUF2064 family)